MKNILFLFLAITVCATIQGGVLSERQIIQKKHPLAANLPQMSQQQSASLYLRH